MTVRQPDIPPALTLTARNTASESDNKIHDDDEARRYGYAGGLVPGVTLYAYLTQVAVAAFGSDWLARGTADCSFRRPVYEGEIVRCEAELAAAPVADAALALGVTRDGLRCAEGVFALADDGGVPYASIDVGDQRTPLPALRPDSVPLGVALAPLHSIMSEADVAAYADATDDPNPWYRGASPFGGPLVPPGWLAARQAPLLRHNFTFGPSIHVRSVMRHVAPAFAGRGYRTSGVIRESFERNGNHYLVLDAETRDDEDRCVCLVQHTTIFSVRPRGD